MRSFITATGTGTGKTFITRQLITTARGIGRHVSAFKPIISGVTDEDMAQSDTGLILEALGITPSMDAINSLSPFRFAAPLAPSMAARLERRTLDFDELVATCHKMLASEADVALIEGVGGVMVPLDDRRTVRDLIAALALPAILVTGNYLGALSHTLTAMETLSTKKIPLHALIVNETPDASVSLIDTADELRRFTKAPVIAVSYARDGKPRIDNNLLPLFD